MMQLKLRLRSLLPLGLLLYLPSLQPCHHRALQRVLSQRRAGAPSNYGRPTRPLLPGAARALDRAQLSPHPRLALSHRMNDRRVSRIHPDGEAEGLKDRLRRRGEELLRSLRGRELHQLQKLLEPQPTAARVVDALDQGLQLLRLEEEANAAVGGGEVRRAQAAAIASVQKTEAAQQLASLEGGEGGGHVTVGEGHVIGGMTSSNHHVSFRRGVCVMVEGID